MLSDSVLPRGKGFQREPVDLDRIIFGSCEYAKDGLLPLTELLGHTAWFHRMRGIADDMIAHAPYETRFGRVPSLSAEVNGEFLQVLSRLAHLTREPRYVEQAIRIGDFHFSEVIPKSNGLPAHRWDQANGKPVLTSPCGAVEDAKMHIRLDYSEPMQLDAGMYPLSLELTVNGTGEGLWRSPSARLYWSSEHFLRQVVPVSNLVHLKEATR